MLHQVKDWLQRKAVSILPSDPEWYRRNGFYRLAAMQSGSVLSGLPGITDPEEAFQVGAFFAAIKVISEDEGSQPLVLYRKSDGKIQQADGESLYEVLHDRANPDMSAGTLVETITAHAATCGTGYASIVRDKAGNIRELWPIDPSDIQREYGANGRSIFKVREGRGPFQEVPRDEIFDLPGFSWDGHEGINVVQAAQRTLGLSLAQDQYSSEYFANDRTPGIVLEYPGDMKPETVERVKKSWRDNEKRHDVAVLQEGMKANRLGKTNTESQLLELRAFQILEVCRWVRLSPHKLGEYGRATYSNVEQMQIDHKNNVLMPWNRRWRQSVYRCLLTEKQRAQGFYAEHTVEVFLRGDFKTQTEGYRALLDKGVYSVNEVRAWYNLNPIEGGDAHLVQMNMQDIVNAAAQSA